MSQILITGVVAVASVAVGFVGSFLLLRKQIVEARKERVRDRKIAAGKEAIDSACELLRAISEFSDMNKAIRRITQNKANLGNVMESPELLPELKAAQPGIHEVATRYRNTVAHTWKGYAALRMSFTEKLSDDYVQFTNYLNSLILEDIHEKWPVMLAKANVIIDELRKEIDGN